jgi:hypothetical protein
VKSLRQPFSTREKPMSPAENQWIAKFPTEINQNKELRNEHSMIQGLRVSIKHLNRAPNVEPTPDPKGLWKLCV